MADRHHSPEEPDLIDFSEQEETVFVPRAVRFINDLKILQVADLLKDRRSCPICQEQYLGGNGSQLEEVVVLPGCGHVFGRTCLQTWLDPKDGEPHDTCPLCRNNVFGLAQTQNDGFGDRANEAEQGWTTEEFVNAINAAFDRAAERDALLRQRHANGIFDDSSLSSRSLWSFPALLLRYFREFDRRHHPQDYNVVFSRADDFDARSVASALNTQLGLCYCELAFAISQRNYVAPWRHNGPSVDFLLSSLSVPLVETTLQMMVEVENYWETGTEPQHWW